ncbi:type II secretion system F family protein [Paraferrimonas sedimenticola]|uniref:Pilus assembly protein TadB n=1 Tax=Paraferrimonas sedimenticola TaxID=375674 RepID=A0AA37RR48_9GAMM|nr:type II secretion system F family protein [Paraferrimonas sedimenticola]GLP94906.1 pilus assembly protein TadB [Paraferrimonas sedimenticola]
MGTKFVFFILVFLAVVLMSQAFFVSVFNPQNANTKALKRHLRNLARDNPDIEASLLVNKRVEKLSVFGRWIESFPFVENLTYRLELAGSKLLGHQYVLIAAALSMLAGLLMWFWTKSAVFVGLGCVVTLLLCHIKISRDINKRMEQIEEQFPEALDVLKRGLQAGYAFSDALRLVYQEMEGHLADEFQLVFARINYGSDLRTALLGFVKRVPSTSAMAFASAVTIQKETGGNLAENIENLSRVIRQRFKFKRRVRTLSAEGRLSGWILVLMPFALFALLYIVAPTYISELVKPEGIQLVQIGLVGMLLGIIWIAKLIRLDV